MIPEPEYDDLFIYAPSFLLAEQIEADGGLFEGKALGTAKLADLKISKALKKTQSKDPKEFANERKKGQTVGKRKLAEIKKRAYGRLMDAIGKHATKRYDADQLRKRMTAAMKEAWTDVFKAGLRAGGVKGPGSGTGEELVKLRPTDEKWLKGAMAHEMQFLNKFIKAILEDTWQMPLARRAMMYVHALESFYDSARVIALPASVVIRWAGPNDKKTCASCEYMFDHNMYTKANLPTTPRAGMTLCLTNCRDRLLIRRVAPSKAKAVLEDSQFSRVQHVNNLRKIKRTGSL